MATSSFDSVTSKLLLPLLLQRLVAAVAAAAAAAAVAAAQVAVLSVAASTAAALAAARCDGLAVALMKLHSITSISSSFLALSRILSTSSRVVSLST